MLVLIIVFIVYKYGHLSIQFCLNTAENWQECIYGWVWSVWKRYPKVHNMYGWVWSVRKRYSKVHKNISQSAQSVLICVRTDCTIQSLLWKQLALAEPGPSTEGFVVPSCVRPAIFVNSSLQTVNQWHKYATLTSWLVIAPTKKATTTKMRGQKWRRA